MNQLTLDRIFGDPDINGAAPKSLQFSPDGMNVTRWDERHLPQEFNREF